MVDTRRFLKSFSMVDKDHFLPTKNYNFEILNHFIATWNIKQLKYSQYHCYWWNTRTLAAMALTYIWASTSKGLQIFFIRAHFTIKDLL